MFLEEIVKERCHKVLAGLSTELGGAKSVHIVAAQFELPVSFDQFGVPPGEGRSLEA